MLNRTRIGWTLTLLFVAALLMGPGPGMELANRPVSVLGFPALYVWGLLWFLVQLTVVILAYFLVWRSDDARDPSASPAPPSSTDSSSKGT